VDYGEEPELHFAHYPSAAAVDSFVDSLAERFPRLATREIIGMSLEGRPISALTIANHAEGSHLERPALLVIAQQHAREPITSQLALYWMERLLQSYGHDDIITHLLDTRTLYVVPQVNPDGNDVFLHVDNGLRSNLRPSDLDGDGLLDEDPPEGRGLYSYQKRLVALRSAWVRGGEPFRSGWNAFHEGYATNYTFSRHLGWVDHLGRNIRQADNDGDGKTNEDGYHGVDLNRNWDTAWQEGDSRISSMLYRGTAPWSEPEVAALRDFITARPNILIGVDLHSGVDMILYPWSITRDSPPDEELLQALARAGTALVESPHTMSGHGLYLAYGTAKDWFYQQGILAITAEIFGASEVAGYRRLWPFHAYITFGSQAHRFNPAPQQITATTERWSPYMTYLLASLPGPSLKGYTVLSEDEVELTFVNTGYLSPSFTVYINGSLVEHVSWDADGSYTIALALQDGKSAELLLEHDSVVSVTTRPSPPTRFLLLREGDMIHMQKGQGYHGPLPSSLFTFGFEAPLDPWGREPWYIPGSPGRQE
jgi:hypothetical protein